MLRELGKKTNNLIYDYFRGGLRCTDATFVVSG